MGAMKVSLVSAALLLLVGRGDSSTEAPTKPHIVFMLVDDWGWANVGYHRDPQTLEVVTPNIDSLVRDGLELDHHYGYRFCSPSRCSFLSGRYPIHVNDQNGPPNVYNRKDPVAGFAGIPRNMTTLGTKMKEAGYVTHQVGKWDAGMATPDHTPKGRGFHTSFGYFHHSNDYFNETAGHCKYRKERISLVDLWETDHPASDKNGTGPDIYEEGLFKEHAVNIVNSHNVSQSLFLYYAAHIVHTPLEVPKVYMDKFSFIDDEDRMVYHAMVNYIDDVVGELVAALKRRGMWDNLLFVVSSDNGGPVYPGGGANNYPLKGGKESDWQGGIRLNAFVSGGFLPAKMRGKKAEGYIHLADWYSTFCALVGIDPKDTLAEKAKLPPVDSMNVWPLISGENSTSPRLDIPISYETLISGEYKILTGKVKQAGWTGPQYPNKTNPSGGIDAVQDCSDGGCLYNIQADPLEQHDLAKDASMSKVLKKIQLKLAHYQKSYFNPDRGEQWPGSCTVAIKDYHGFWGPFLP